MAKQPAWTIHPAHVAWYAKMTKAKMTDAAVIFAEALGYKTLEEIKTAIKEAARVGAERFEHR